MFVGSLSVDLASLRPSGAWVFNVARRVLEIYAPLVWANENIVRLTVDDRIFMLLWCGTEAK